MKVIEKFHPDNGYGGDPLLHLDLKRYENQCEDFYLFMGDAYEEIFKEEYLQSERRYLSLEEPNFCMQKDSWHEHLTVGKDGKLPPKVVYTLCPYTIESLKDTNDNRKLIFFPFNENYITQKQKDIVFVYTGSQPPIPFFNDIFKNIKSKGINYAYAYYARSEYTTHHSLSYKDKIDLISRSNITLCHGLFNAWGGWKHLEFIASDKNVAFDEIRKGNMIGPQVKSRTFEAAFGKSLILMYKDPWNVTELWFTPEEDFIYFSTLEEALFIIEDFKIDPSKYQRYIDSAYNKAINNYTTKHFIDLLNE